MSQYKSYPAYKDSGVKWLGQLPLQWEVKRIKHTAYLKGRVGWKGLTSEEYLDQGYAYLVTGTDFTSKFIDWSNCHCVTQERYEDDPFIQLRNGDLLMTKDGTIGKLALVSGLDKEACLNSGIFLVRPEKSYTTQFLYWVLSAKLFSDFCYLFNSGATILHLYQNVFENFALPIPNYSEQDRITSYLENETARIDALVGKKTSFIELLREKRQALITHAVTKGLDPNVKMKDSGVKWLGQIPEHWEYGRFIYACNLLVDGTHHSPDNYPEGDYLYITAKNIKEHGFDLSDISYISQEDHLQIYPRCPVQKGDVLYIKDGATAGIAMVNDFEEEFSLLSSVALIRPNPNQLKSKFVAYHLNAGAFKKDALSQLVGGAITRFTLDMISRFVIVRPPLDEQNAIIGYLEREMARIDVLMQKTQQSIDLLKERRTALITAAVTGQIDLREVAR